MAVTSARRGQKAAAARQPVADKRGGEMSGSYPYLQIFRASPSDRIRIIKNGVPALEAKRILADLHLDQRVLLDALNLKTATVNRKAARREALPPEDGERVIGVAKLVGQVEAMLAESSEHGEFDVLGWLSRWLREPLPSLGGLKPISLLDTMEGQALVSQALAQMRSGAYA